MGEAHGYLRDKRGRLTTIDVPGALTTAAWRTNNRGQVVGAYSDVDRQVPLRSSAATSTRTGGSQGRRSRSAHQRPPRHQRPRPIDRPGVGFGRSRPSQHQHQLPAAARRHHHQTAGCARRLSDHLPRTQQPWSDRRYRAVPQRGPHLRDTSRVQVRQRGVHPDRRARIGLDVRDGDQRPRPHCRHYTDPAPGTPGPSAAAAAADGAAGMPMGLDPLGMMDRMFP